MMDLDSYSDEDLDNLDGDLLQQLENNAIQFTQKQAQSQAPPRTQYEPQRPPRPALASGFQLPGSTAEQPQYISDDDDDFDNGEVIDQAAQPLNLQRSGLPNPAPQPFRAVPSIAGQQRLNHQQQQANQQRYGQQQAFRPNPQFAPSQHPRGPLGAPGRPLPQSQFLRQQPQRPAQITQPYVGQRPPTTQGLRGAGLDADKQKDETIRGLEAELSNLRTQLTTAKGEANLIRSKYDRDIPQLKKEMAEEMAKMERRLQEAQKAQQAASNELLFANADLQEERGRAKTKKVGRDGAMTPGGRNKTKFMQMPDGFSEVEVLGMGSPSRDRAGRRERLRDQGNGGGTPTKGKRKRPAVDSPSFALEMETDGGVFEDPGLFALRSNSTRSGPSLPYDVSQHLLSPICSNDH